MTEQEINEYKNFSEYYIKSHNVDWNKVSEFSILSEDFIHEFRDKVNWDKIMQHQILSKEFIIENLSYINLHSSNNNDLLNKLLECQESLKGYTKERLCNEANIILEEKYKDFHKSLSSKNSDNILDNDENLSASKEPKLDSKEPKRETADLDLGL